MNRKHFITAALALTLCMGAGAQEQEIRVFSHRGGRMEFDENTLEAFLASADAGYRGFDTDIRITKDGVLVIAHDATLERCTNGTGVLEEKTLKEIKALTTDQRKITKEGLGTFFYHVGNVANYVSNNFLIPFSRAAHPDEDGD